MSPVVMASLRFASVVFWKYLGDDGFNIIEADEWEDRAENCHTIAVRPPCLEQRQNYFSFNVPSAYVVGVRPGDYSARIAESKSEGRGVVSVPGALDPRRLYRAW